MSWLEFEYLPISTMTSVAKLKGKINIEYIFNLLPLTHLNLSVDYMKKKRNKFPIAKVPGSIISISYGTKRRGLVKRKNKKPWRNSVVVDISTSRKNINMKISKSSIHMTGTDSISLCREASGYIINYIIDIQDTLDYIQDNLQLSTKIINSIIELTKGQEYIINIKNGYSINIKDDDIIKNGLLYNSAGEIYLEDMSTLYLPEKHIVIDDGIVCDINKNPFLMVDTGGEIHIAPYHHNHKDNPNMVKIVSEIHNNSEMIRALQVIKAKNLIFPSSELNEIRKENSRIYDFAISFIYEYLYHNEYEEFLRSLLVPMKVYEEKLCLDAIYPHMVNYSYVLKMSINRAVFAKKIAESEIFNVEYKNTSDHHVRIRLPLGIDKNNKKKKIEHTFMVYQSGLVMQSSPNRKLAEEAYNIFLNTVDKFKDEIKSDGPYYMKFFSKNVITTDESTDDNILTVAEAFNLKYDDKYKLEYDVFLRILESYWDLIGNSESSATLLNSIFEKCTIEEKINYFTITLKYYELIKNKISFLNLDEKRSDGLIRSIISDGYISSAEIINNPESLEEYKDLPLDPLFFNYNMDHLLEQANQILGKNKVKKLVQDINQSWDKFHS